MYDTLTCQCKGSRKVGSEEAWKRAGAMGLIVKDNGVQAVYGPKADVLKSDIEDLLASGVDIPEPVIAESTTGVPATNFLGKKKISWLWRQGSYSNGASQ